MKLLNCKNQCLFTSRRVPSTRLHDSTKALSHQHIKQYFSVSGYNRVKEKKKKEILFYIIGLLLGRVKGPISKVL